MSSAIEPTKASAGHDGRHCIFRIRRRPRSLPIASPPHLRRIARLGPGLFKSKPVVAVQ
jgi:hypothetical protein